MAGRKPDGGKSDRDDGDDRKPDRDGEDGDDKPDFDGEDGKGPLPSGKPPRPSGKPDGPPPSGKPDGPPPSGKPPRPSSDDEESLMRRLYRLLEASKN